MNVLSKKAKYGIRAAMYLAARAGGPLVGIQEIADNENIPKKFLDAILLELRNVGLLQSRKGKGGGYAIGRPPSEITVGAIIRVLDGPLALTPCASRSAYQPCDDCPNVETCRLRRVMIEVREATAQVLDQHTLADLVTRGADYVPDFVI